MMMRKLKAFVAIAALCGACGAEDDTSGEMAAVRPGEEDSSKEFKGSLSPHQAAFWEAVRDADDAARARAAVDLAADADDDSSDGYSAFLAGAHAFMPNRAELRALADGKAIPQDPGLFTADTAPLLEQAVANLTDPLYLGFSATLLSGLQFMTDPVAAQKTLKIATSNNVPASSFGQTAQLASMGDAKGALAALTGILDFCEGKPIDRANPDVAGYVARANASQLAHRECYSGYLAPHGTEGTLLIMGDLHWTSGDEKMAKRYYAALPDATNYKSWPLHDLAERRLAGTQPVKPTDLGALVKCSTCHVNELAP